MATSDRSGRTHFETYSVTPGEGTRDPLEIYFSFGGFMGGGLTGFEFLSSEPVVIKFVLNEWVSFDQPGNYRVRVTSSRVTDTTLSWKEKGSSLEVTSDEMELTIVPADKQWQQLELRRIVAALDANSAPSGPRDPAAEPLTALRYLGTEEAARELARRLATGANVEWQCMFGLLGSPHAAEGLVDMRALLRDPNVRVTPMFLRAMSYLPLHAGQAPSALQEQFERNMESSRTELIAALPSKRGKALAVSTETALDGLSAGAPEAQRKSLSQQVPVSFGAGHRIHTQLLRAARVLWDRAISSAYERATASQAGAVPRRHGFPLGLLRAGRISGPGEGVSRGSRCC